MSISEAKRAILVRPLASAAVATRYVETARLHQERMQTRLSDGFARQHGMHYQPTALTTTVRHHSLADVVLDADTLILLQGGLPIPETAYFLPPRSTERPEIDAGRLIRLDDGEDLIIGYNNAHDGYQHWLTQCVPAIDWSLRQRHVRPTRLVLPRLAPWQAEILDLLGLRMMPRLMPEAGKQYLLPHCDYAEFLNGSTAFGICLSTLDTARRLLAAVPSVASPHRVLYVPYADPYYGSIDNDREVLDMLESRGVFVVDENREKVADRINLFRHADVIIGPHSGSLTDILFCKPGALLWEWMPQHFQNASMNRLAQAAGVDYWGDLLEPVADPDSSRRLRVNVAGVAHRLREISQRLAVQTTETVPRQVSTYSDAGTTIIASKPIDELMLAFESLGDNCEFGLIQRHARVEPLGLLRFAGIRLQKLVAGLQNEFSDLGAAGTITVALAGEPGRQEFMISESVYDVRYHSGMGEADIEPEALREREAARLTFLRRKLLEDLRSGEKICVWKSPATTSITQVQPLLDVLRALGPNVLLWVVEADASHPPGTVERLDRDFIKGYIECFAPYDNATAIRPVSWFEVCQAAYNLCHPDQQRPDPATLTPAPSQQPLSAMAFLAGQQARACSVEPPPAAARATGFHWLLTRFGMKRR